MSRAALRQLVEETLAPFAARLALSRARSAQVTQALVAFQRLCEPGGTPRARVQLSRRPYFADGLALFELMVEATGEGREALAAWQAAASHQGRVEEMPPDAPAGGEVRRRRRRRRRRRGGAGGGAARETG
jgi:hypothetical protein